MRRAENDLAHARELVNTAAATARAETLLANL
jgi:hypothetical protein